MPEEQISGLPPRLRERLDEAIPIPRGSEEEVKRQWSLSDIDRLLSEVGEIAAGLPAAENAAFAGLGLADAAFGMAEGSGGKVEEAGGKNATPTDIAPPIKLLEPQPVGAAFMPPEVKPAPKPIPEPPPPAPDPPPPTITIRAAEVSEPAPEPEPLRFDLFRTGPLEKPSSPQPTRPIWSGPIEKPGVLLRRVDMQMTSDLSPVPKVVPAEDMIVRAQKVPEEDIPEGQQRFADFEEEAPPHSVEEAEMLARLEKGKKERTAQFQTLRSLSARLEKDGETGEPPPAPESGAPEYRKAEQRDSIFQLLVKSRGRRAGAALALGGCALLAAGLQGIALFNHAFNMGPPHLAALALLLAAGLVICAGDLSQGLKALIQRRPNANSILLLAALASAAQTVLLFVFMEAVGADLPADNPYRVAACVPLFLFTAALCAAARWQQARQRCDNFRFCAYTAAEGLYAVTPMDGRNAAMTARQRALPGRAKTVLPVPIAFPAGFIQQSMEESAADRDARRLLPVAAALAVLAALCSYLLQGKAVAVVSAAAVVLCLCVPCASLWLLANMIRGLTRAPRENGLAILNTEAAEECSRAGAFVLDSADLYLPERGRMHGWREFRQVRADEVLLYAAGIAIAAGGPLQAVFEGVVEGDYAVLPDVKDLTYEDRMGLSCWIHNQKVFFGNRNLLENHGISVILSEKDEKKYEHDGRKIIYLAVEKKLSAFFVVSYCPDAAVAPAFQLLEREDMEALITNSDPCVSAEVLGGAFGLQERALSLLRTLPGEACRGQMRTPRSNLAAGVYHAGNARAFLRALSACVTLRAGIRRLRLFQLVGSVTACVILLLFVFMGQLHVADSLLFIAWGLIWAAVMQAAVRN
ncbi:MAG: hypothetical protein FWE98_03905 [Oscillospiraceae bacterium]|nr:hypothetical protein [Oscillospiraceae bacterium]